MIEREKETDTGRQRVREAKEGKEGKEGYEMGRKNRASNIVGKRE